MNEPNCLVKCLRADGDLAALSSVVAAAGKGVIAHFLAQRAQRCDESIFQRGLVHAHARRWRGLSSRISSSIGLLVGFRRMRKQIQAIAETLHIENLAVRARHFPHGRKRLAKFGRAQLDALGMQALAKFVRRADLPDFAQVNQCDAMAPLGFVEIRRGDHHSEALHRRGARACPRIRGAKRDRRRWSAHRAAKYPARKRARTPAPSFCFMPPLNCAASRFEKRSMSNIFR